MGPSSAIDRKQALIYMSNHQKCFSWYRYYSWKSRQVYVEFSSIFFPLFTDYGFYKLEVATTTNSGVCFKTTGSSNHDTGKVSGGLETKYKLKDYGKIWTSQAPIPLTVFRSNSKFNQNLECSSLKFDQSITTKFCTRQDSYIKDLKLWDQDCDFKIKLVCLICLKFSFHQFVCFNSSDDTSQKPK